MLKSKTIRASMLTLALLSIPALFQVMSVAQDAVTGAIEGKVVSAKTGEAIAGAVVRVTNEQTGVPNVRRTNNEGVFHQGLLPPGTYTIRISAEGFKTVEVKQRVLAATSTRLLPYPTPLETENAGKP